MQSIFFLFVLLVPLVFGAGCILFREQAAKIAVFGLALNFVCVVVLILTGDGTQALFSVAPSVSFVLQSDAVSRLFSLLFSAMFLTAGVYSIGYFKHHQNPSVFYAFYCFAQFALMGVCYAGSLVTMYLFFECLTMCTFPMVLFDRTRESVAAGIKYMLYSITGAMMGLLGVVYLTANTTSQLFVSGGSLDASLAAAPTGLLLAILFLCIVGFGTKAGIFPMHGWLPTAHPLAPTPASAVLSGVIVKAGVLCIIRVIYYAVGADVLRGTWVQTALLTLSLLTILIGSAQAMRQKHIKRRLAYSTVSQVSYILFGLFMLNQASASGAVLHAVFHSIMKTCLFLCAGAVMVNAGTPDTDKMAGIGKSMPATMWSFTIAGVGLVGIPPLSGFVSKWVLAQGAVQSGTAVFSWLGPVVILISALLTAGYIAPVSLTAFFPGQQADIRPSREAQPVMLVPLLVLAGLTVLFGIYSAPLQQAVQSIVQSIL